MTILIKDPRPIQRLETEEYVWIVGRRGISEINVYDEAGQNAYVPWFEIWKGDDLIGRVNGAYVVSVEYTKIDEND